MADLTISQKLDSIINTKANIKQAIINKGQQVNDVFDTYAAAIENIQTSPSVENLDTQLNTQDNLLNTQNITISNIANALNGKSLPGGGSIDANSVYDLQSFKESGQAGESILRYVKVYPAEIDMSNRQGSLYGLFDGCKYMETVPNIVNFDGYNQQIDSMYAFNSCSSLNNVDLNLNNCTGFGTMSYMFCNCKNLKIVNFIQPNSFHTPIDGDFVTTQVADFMFYNCRSLTNININNGWLYVSSLAAMFSNCYSLTDLSNITINVTELSSDPVEMFRNCCNITNFPLFEGKSNYNITSLGSMFVACSNINDLILSNILNCFNLNNVTDISHTFLGCSNLNSLPNQINYENIYSFNYSFGGMNITDINISISNASSLQSAFSPIYTYYNDEAQMDSVIVYNSPLTNLTLTNCDNVQYLDYMCASCENLKSVNIYNLTSTVFQTPYVFENCYNLVNVSFDNCNFSNVYNVSNMFTNCYNLVNCPNISTLSSLLQQADFMFANCYNLVNVPTLNVEQVTSAYAMFENCHNLSNQSLENILNMRPTQVGYTYSYFGITENQFNIMKNLPSFQNAVNNGWSETYI